MHHPMYHYKYYGSVVSVFQVSRITSDYSTCARLLLSLDYSDAATRNSFFITGVCLHCAALTGCKQASRGEPFDTGCFTMCKRSNLLDALLLSRLGLVASVWGDDALRKPARLAAFK